MVPKPCENKTSRVLHHLFEVHYCNLEGQDEDVPLVWAAGW
jgi:hypothetical protein